MNESKYFHVLLAFRLMVEKYGAEQVQYDLNRLASDFQVEITQVPRDLFAQPSLDFDVQPMDNTLV